MDRSVYDKLFSYDAKAQQAQLNELLTAINTYGDYFDVAKFREEISGKRIRLIALVTSFVDA